ncbi:MAG TPA: STAS domain-containing protein [Candidatus Limnocylindria bacterium]|nr:STAS domain-containing protein [Candidatus Limnocylindria bacterium]
MVSAFGIRVIVRSDDTALVRIHGELDAFTATAFRAGLEEASLHRNVVVDLSEIRFISAGAIGILIGCTTRASGQRFAVAAPLDSWVRRVMALCAYPYPIAESLDDGLRALGLPYRRLPRASVGPGREVSRGRRGLGVRHAGLR